MQLTLPLAEYQTVAWHLSAAPAWPRALLTVLLLGSIGLQLVNPQIIRYFIDATQTPGDADAAGLRGHRLYRDQRGATPARGRHHLPEHRRRLERHQRACAPRLTEHLLRLDMPFHKTHTPGELIERVDGDVTELADFFSQLIIRVVSNCLLIVGVLVLLFVEDWRAGLALSLYSCRRHRCPGSGAGTGRAALDLCSAGIG